MPNAPWGFAVWVKGAGVGEWSERSWEICSLIIKSLKKEATLLFRRPNPRF
jgi:hypothetical protein